jgi:lysozyme family protein
MASLGVEMFPLVAIATSLLPDLIQLIAGDKTGTVATDVASAVQKITGTSDAAAAKQKIDTDPTAAANLQIQLAQIALAASKVQSDAQNQQQQATLDELKQRLADVQSARATEADLAKDQSPIAWIPAAVSFLVMVGFYVLLWILIRDSAGGANGDLSKNQLINICIGALVAAFSTVVNFWLGSSKGSQDKDRAQVQQTSDIIRQQVQQTNAAQNTATSALQTVAASAAAAGASKNLSGASSTPPKTDASTNFSQCLHVVLREEGGYTNDPNDPGGATNFGITIADLREWRGHDVTPDDVKNMTKAEALEIYRAKYWNPMQCGDLPDGIDLEVFDFGVNAGIRTSVKMLQLVIGVTQDGSVGPITLNAAKAANARSVIQAFSQHRLDYYRSLTGEWPHFGAGWTNRTNSVEQAALDMAGPTTVLG